MNGRIQEQINKILRVRDQLIEMRKRDPFGNEQHLMQPKWQELDQKMWELLDLMDLQLVVGEYIVYECEEYPLRPKRYFIIPSLLPEKEK